MTVYLFIWTITAGATTTPLSSANYQEAKWKGQWAASVKFDRPEFCHKAAANLGLAKTEYRCIDLGGELK